MKWRKKSFDGQLLLCWRVENEYLSNGNKNNEPNRENNKKREFSNIYRKTFQGSCVTLWAQNKSLSERDWEEVLTEFFSFPLLSTSYLLIFISNMLSLIKNFLIKDNFRSSYFLCWKVIGRIITKRILHTFSVSPIPQAFAVSFFYTCFKIYIKPFLFTILTTQPSAQTERVRWKTQSCMNSLFFNLSKNRWGLF